MKAQLCTTSHGKYIIDKNIASLASTIITGNPFIKAYFETILYHMKQSGNNTTKINTHKTRLYTCLILFLILFLGGCTTNTEQQTIYFDNFSISIPANFKSIHPRSIENKQIINKVLASYQDDQNNDIFITNLVITRTNLNHNINGDYFWSINNSKMEDMMIGYKLYTYEPISFSCQGESIRGILAHFSLNDTLFHPGKQYIFEQFHFVYQKQGYIISTASEDTNKGIDLKKLIKTLQCK